MTHNVVNQAVQPERTNPAEYPVIAETLGRAGATDRISEVLAVGAAAGSPEVVELSRLADEHHPVLKTHDRYGFRVDEVIYDPAYHQLMRRATEFGLHGYAWADAAPQPHLVRAAKMLAWMQSDAGHTRPISMTYDMVPALRSNPELSALYEPLLCARDYDPILSVPSTKRALTAGMSMTEKQGGSDVRANTTRAVEQADGSYRLTGHKWFTSAPMSDLFLALAQTDAGPTCFLVPRVCPDGARNGMFLQRLKDKLGNHSNASSEIEYASALAWRVGPEGRGVPTIAEMVNVTRLECLLQTTSLLCAGVQRAAFHVTHRQAFGRALIDQPLMRNVLADLAIEAEAATTVGLWLASLADRVAAGDQEAAALRRIALAVSKYYVCKRGPMHVAEALECFGGNGYVEESGMPRLYREAPIPSIWEGTGNVAALDALRALNRQPETLPAFVDELRSSSGADPRLDLAINELEKELADIDQVEYRARALVGTMAKVLQASLLVRNGNDSVAAAFIATRLGDRWGDAFGTLPRGLHLGPILERANWACNVYC